MRARNWPKFFSVGPRLRIDDLIRMTTQSKLVLIFTLYHLGFEPVNLKRSEEPEREVTDVAVIPRRIWRLKTHCFYMINILFMNIILLDIYFLIYYKFYIL